jgi:hypothetical protein
MTHTIFIDGEAGTTGLEIRERLEARPDLKLLLLGDRRRDADARREALNGADAVILCLPDDAAREAVFMIENPSVKVIDASTAYRVAPGWAYGFPEMDAGQRALIARSSVRVESRLLSHRLHRPDATAGEGGAGSDDLSGHGQCGLGLLRRRQGDDRRVRGPKSRGRRPPIAPMVCR